MKLKEYQLAALRTALPSAHSSLYLIPGLVAEAGEVAGVYAKFNRDHTDWTDARASLKKELGDVLWFVAVLADYLGYSLEEVAEANLEKLQSRQQRGVIGGSGDNR